jgi:hypothetical protein
MSKHARTLSKYYVLIDMTTTTTTVRCQQGNPVTYLKFQMQVTRL